MVEENIWTKSQPESISRLKYVKPITAQTEPNHLNRQPKVSTIMIQTESLPIAIVKDEVRSISETIRVVLWTPKHKAKDLLG